MRQPMFYDLKFLHSHGTRPCLIHRDQIVSYQALATQAADLARDLPAARGLVAIEMAPNPTVIAAYLGALAAGHAVLPLPVGGADQAAETLARFRPAARIDGAGQVVMLADPTPLHPDLGLLLQTSGSTGQGKGVRLSYRALEANAAAIATYLELGPGDRAALILPLHYSYGLSVLHSHLARGASLWLSETSVLAPDFTVQLAQSGATSLSGVPHHFTMLETAEFAEALPPALTCLTVAGGAMAPADARRWAARIGARGGKLYLMYGQTEATARIAYLPPDQVAAHAGAIGGPIPGGELALAGPDGAHLNTPEAEGELLYRGPNVMMGYAETAADLARGPEIEWLATGDLAHRDAQGLYRITGRLSRMSKIAGLRIGHDALERALAEAGHEAAVWGDDTGLQIAVRGAADGVEAEAAALAGIGLSQVAVQSLSDFPRRANGKIDYGALAAQATPAPAETDLIGAFQKVFPKHQLQLSDSFAKLGGDSLKHVELSLLLERRLGGLPAQWEEQPISALEAAPVARSYLPLPILARALAILAVVVAHQTNFPVYGGAAAMVMLLGMSVADHRLPALIQRDIGGFLAPVLRVLWPYYLILLGYALAWEQIPWVSVVLMGNFALTTPETHLMLPYLYWFIEAYMQMTLLLLLLFWPPSMRRALAANPFAVGMGLIAFAFALRLSIPELWPLPAGRSQFSLPWVFYLFALGWGIACAKSLPQKLLVLGAAAIIMPTVAYLGGNWYGAWYKYMGLLALSGLLLFVPRVPFPRLGVRGVIYLAQAAFPIYLLHRFVPEEIMPALGLALPGWAEDLVAIGGGLGIGLLVAAILRAPLWPRLWAMRPGLRSAVRNPS